MNSTILTPRRWDLVLFHFPEEPSIIYVKRHIGFPGEYASLFLVRFSKKPRASNLNDKAEIDTNKIDDTVLALLWLTMCGDNRAWKGHDWDALGRLHEKNMIGDPVGKAKSVSLTPEGLERSKRLFYEMFAKRN
jgi:Domain of unknown function (DUF6429)/Signal peptidase, peptidase S26